MKPKPLEIHHPTAAHCFTVQFDGTSSLEADTERGRTRAERIYEIRRRYLLKVENSCAHQLTNCRLLLMSAVDADGKEHIRTPLATCEPFSLSPGEPATVPVIAIIFENFEKPIRFDPVSEALPGTILLPPDSYTLSLRMLSDDSAPFSFRLAVEGVESTWIVRQIDDDPVKQLATTSLLQPGELLTLKPTLWGMSIDLKELWRRARCWWKCRWKKRQ